jgi:vesicle transport through interaction with t-SNAREs protein 1
MPQVSGDLRRYELELSHVIESANADISSLASEAGAEARRHVVSRITHWLRTANDLLARMELEAKSTEGGDLDRAAAESVVSDGRQRVVRLRRSLRDVEQALQREELISRSQQSSGPRVAREVDATDAPLLDTTKEHRAGVAGVTDTLVKASLHIQDSKRVLAETESVGANVLADLEAQGRTLERSYSRLQSMGSRLLSSSGIISAMRGTERMRRLHILGLVGAVLLSIGALMTIKVWPHKGGVVDGN